MSKKANEIYMIYVKKKVSDPVFDYKKTVNTWKECMKALELFAKDYEGVSFLNIVEGAEVLERSFTLDGEQNNMNTIKNTGSTLKL